MRRATLAVTVVSALLIATAVLPCAIAFDAESELQTLRLRLRDIEGAAAYRGFSVFNWRLAGFVSSTSSSFASEYLTTEDISTGKTLATACSSDFSTLCKPADAPLAGSVPDTFHRNKDLMECLADHFAQVSDECLDAAHIASNYMRLHRDTLKLAMRKVSVKSTFENFKTQCATEISSSCPAGSLAVDPTAAVGVAPEPATADFQPPKPREHADGKPPMRGPGRRRLHRHEASSSDEERGVSRKDLKGINHLSTQLGECVANVAPAASETCLNAVNALTHVAEFATSGFDSRRRALWRDGDSPRDSVAGPRRWSDDDRRDARSDSEDEDDDDTEFSGGDRRSNWRHHRHHDKAGGFVGFVLLVSVITLSICLCRRRRMIRHLRERVHQLEMAAIASGNTRVVGQPQQQTAYPVAVGIPMPVSSAPPASSQRVASEATQENASLLQRGPFSF